MLAKKLRFLRTGYIRTAKVEVLFRLTIYLTGYVGAKCSQKSSPPFDCKSKW